jgi:hypothetical protein
MYICIHTIHSTSPQYIYETIMIRDDTLQYNSCAYTTI